MARKTKLNLSPTKFRAILIAAMITLISAGVIGFYAAHQALDSYSTEISDKVAEAEASKSSVERLRQLEAELERQSDIRERAQSIVAESQSYQYQNQIISDLNNYARQSGLSLSQFTFQSDVDSSSSSAGSSSESGSQSPRGGGGLKSTTVSVSLNPPVQYTNLLRFMRSIEQNLTKMQIAGISLTPGEDTNTVSTTSLNIEVYIR